MSAAIVCRDLRKRYPARPVPVDAVNGLDLEIDRGECFGLLGPNGAGKTTTIEILEGLLPESSGDVEVLGQRWGRGDDRALRQRLGISLQETKLGEKLTVRETVILFRSFYDRGIEPDLVIEQVGLNEKARSWVGKLSGGQKQRLAIAIALVGDPELLFLDEPTTGLDPQSRRQLWDILRGLRAQGRTILLTTHYMDEAERLCDRVAVVDHGKVIALGTPAQLIAQIGGEHLIEFRAEAAQHSAFTAPGVVVDPHREASPAPDPPIEADDLRRLPAVVQVRRDSDGLWSLAVTAPHVTLPALLEHLRQREASLAHLVTRHASLEDVFVTLTGRHLRDGD